MKSHSRDCSDLVLRTSLLVVNGFKPSRIKSARMKLKKVEVGAVDKKSVYLREVCSGGGRGVSNDAATTSACFTD